MKTREYSTVPGTKGRVLHWAVRYDLLVRLLLLGREGPFRERLVQLARLEPGQSVLDVGCGTGSLAIAAKRRVGAGDVYGIDASPEMIARARRKAGKAGVHVHFTEGVVEALLFPDRHVDTVLSTLMLHHLPREARRRCVREIRRVLKPGGRVLAVDFGKPPRGQKGLLAHLHRHGGIDVHDIAELFSEAGFEVIETGAVGVRSMNFVLTTAR